MVQQCAKVRQAATTRVPSDCPTGFTEDLVERLDPMSTVNVLMILALAMIASHEEVVSIRTQARKYIRRCR